MWRAPVVCSVGEVPPGPVVHQEVAPVVCPPPAGRWWGGAPRVRGAWRVREAWGARGGSGVREGRGGRRARRPRVAQWQRAARVVKVAYQPLEVIPSENMPNDFTDKDANLGTAPVAVPDIVTSSTNPADWLEATSNDPPTFAAHDAGPATGITFRLLYEVHHQRYSAHASDATEDAVQANIVKAGYGR